MGWFDSLFGRKEKPSSPEEVRRLLFDAAARGDDAALAKLAETHEPTVLEHFGVWKKVPEGVRRDPTAVQAYAQGLIRIAQHFAAARGRPELFAALAGPTADNPIVRWEKALAAAGEQMEAGDYAGAAGRLRAALDGAKGLSGSAVDSYLPVTLGQLGTCLFHTGDAEGAVAPMERALALCEAQQDDDGTRAYLGNLHEIHRYRGDAEAAANCLDRLADHHERLGDGALARRDRAQAKIVRAGEPLCRVVAEIDGRQMELADMPSSPGRVRFIFARNRITLRPSAAATEAAVELGKAGDLDAALQGFQRAAELDRFDPWPSYHAGMTLLYLRRYREAAASFARTEELAPGFYHCRSDRWLAEQLAEGAVDHALFETVRALVDGALPPEEAVAEARRALGAKEMGLLHLTAGDTLARLDRDAEAEAEYRRGLAIAEEPDVKTRLLAALGGRVADPLEKARLLQEAIDLRGNLVSAAMATAMLRATAS
jgi:tetratricopeptide (TPR) repeat protein